MSAEGQMFLILIHMFKIDLKLSTNPYPKYMLKMYLLGLSFHSEGLRAQISSSL